MSSIIFFALSLLFVRAFSDVYYTSQRENCSVNIPNSICYNGPRIDSYGQYLSCSVPGTFALTLEDGPSIYTSHILDVLKEHNMTATFFILGRSIHAYHDVIQRMVNEGHQIASHTYDHANLNILADPAQEMIDFEIALVNEYFTGPLFNGSIPNYMRSPYGNLSNFTYDIIKNQLGYLPVNWGFLTQDTDNISESSIIPRYQSRLGGSTGEGVVASALELITQQHDTQEMTSDSFEELATYLQNVFGTQGVRFVTVAECLGNIVPAYRPNPRLQSELNPTNPPSSNSTTTSFPIWAIVLIAVVGAALIFSAITVIYRCCRHTPEPPAPLPVISAPIPSPAPSAPVEPVPIPSAPVEPVPIPSPDVIITVLADPIVPVLVTNPPPLDPITPSPAPPA
jgi:peptidoglycan/xylan/chitin deacetylase (PgdA/CDA1 family)